ncbi:MAG: LysR substrate-binding domain-containing protein, partial [Candidatus Caenarcaniphilales bacterium]|nr:LysR substrate-binding domain-containing protein [Candidatus Caenarcaniphilales bacterium]
MNIRDLEYFVTLIETKHFAKAAKKCFVSQPTLSIQIKKLETELGVDLIERSNKSFHLTSTGREIYFKALDLIQKANEIEEIAKAHQEPLTGNFKLGAFPTLAPYLFPKIIPWLSSKFPNIKFLLKEEKTNVLIKQLKEGEIDAALLASPIEEGGLEEHKLFREDFYLAVPKSHKLAKKDFVNIKDLRGKELLLLEDGHCLRNQALEVCFTSGASEQQEFRATSLETLRQMIAIGGGITLMPEIALQENEGIE